MKMTSIAVLVAAVAMPLAAAELPSRPGDRGTNLRFTFTVVDTGTGAGPTERSIHVLALDGRHSRLQTGWRLPIATTTTHAATEVSDRVPVTSYQYQDVGVSVALEGRLVEEGMIRVSGRIEISAVDPGSSPGASAAPAPRLGTFSHAFDVVLVDGRPTSIAEVPRPDGGSTSLGVTATVVDD